jgi:hypothetical protein
MRKILKAALLVPLILTAAACQPVSFNVHANGTVSPVAPRNSLQPSASIPGAPAPVTASPLPVPTVTVTQTVYVNLSQCIPSPVTELYLENLAGSPYGTAPQMTALIQCLQIPQGNQSQFVLQVETYANLGQSSGLFGTQEGRDAFARGSSQVTCPDGQQIYSLYQIYAQYR